jgi:hypothetical protein
MQHIAWSAGALVGANGVGTGVVTGHIRTGTFINVMASACITAESKSCIARALVRAIRVGALLTAFVGAIIALIDIIA